MFGGVGEGYDNPRCSLVVDYENAYGHEVGMRHGRQQVVEPLLGEARCTRRSKGQQGELVRRTVTVVSICRATARKSENVPWLLGTRSGAWLCLWHVVNADFQLEKFKLRGNK